MSRDPVSWLLIEPGWTVYDAAGEKVGKVKEVLADEQADIFHGVLVDRGLLGPGEEIVADQVEEADKEDDGREECEQRAERDLGREPHRVVRQECLERSLEDGDPLPGRKAPGTRRNAADLDGGRRHVSGRGRIAAWRQGFPAAAAANA